MADNFEIAVINKVNVIAERFGIAPHELCFEAGFRYSTNYRLPQPGEQPTHYAVDFIHESAEGPAQERLERMHKALGTSEDGRLIGSPEEIWTQLNATLARAPRRHDR